MSAIFGVCLPHGSTVDRKSVFDLAAVTRRYGADEMDFHIHGQIGMGFQAFYTHSRSRLGRQPAMDSLGNLVIFDGRLDNYRELESQVGIEEEVLSDSDLILKAYTRWGEDCFSHFIGDWALVLWSAKDCSLYLARDHAGSRTLFYRNADGEIRWSSYLETFFVNSCFPEVDQTYMARVLSCLELSDSTPYKGIHAVPPAHYLVFRKGVLTLRSHWNSVAETKIEYKSNAEYDEHFLSLFRQAVERRVVPGSLILAELSGGMDSSSIVCMADTVVRASSDSTELIDTISYYDPTEPDWDESPYFEAVEKHRGKSGIHLDCSTRVPSYEPLILLDRVYPYPGSDSTSLRIATELDSNIGRYRVILSGMGGDELLGGVPAPLPELADYLRGARFLTLISRATEWCLVSRQPVIYMLFNALVFTTNLYRPSRLSGDTVPPWLNSEMRQKCFSLNVHDAAKRPRYRDIPSAINGGRVWQTVLDALPHLVPPLVGCHEYRYPYLDRDLVDFLHRVPREQLVGPGRRRLLMRRALKGIVPIEVLERKRKACISRGPLFVLRNAHQKIEELFSDSFCADCGLIDRDKFLRAFRSGIRGDLKWIGQLTRTIGLELWLHSIEGSLSSFRAAPK